MKKEALILVSLLLFEVAYAIECDNRYDVSAVFFNDTDKCEDLSYVKIEDIGCEPFPPPGNCWRLYSEAVLHLPDGLYTQKELEIILESDKDSYEWVPIVCEDEAVYNINVIFSNEISSCTKTLTLNLTSPKVDDKNDDIDSSIEDKKTPVTLLLTVLLIVLIALITSLFFIFRKK